ncbi:GFA family protein [Paraburkholderia caballeronis]
MCHFTECRKAAAAPLVSCFQVKREEFELVHGVPKSFASSA